MTLIATHVEVVDLDTLPLRQHSRQTGWVYPDGGIRWQLDERLAFTGVVGDVSHGEARAYDGVRVLFTFTRSEADDPTYTYIADVPYRPQPTDIVFDSLKSTISVAADGKVTWYYDTRPSRPVEGYHLYSYPDNIDYGVIAWSDDGDSVPPPIAAVTGEFRVGEVKRKIQDSSRAGCIVYIPGHYDPGPKFLVRAFDTGTGGRFFLKDSARNSHEWKPEKEDSYFGIDGVHVLCDSVLNTSTVKKFYAVFPHLS